MLRFALIALLTSSFLFSNQSYAQSALAGRSGVMTEIGLPFLLVIPEARAAGMGRAGVAGSVSSGSAYFNAAKPALSDQQFELAVSHAPLLRQLVNNMSSNSLFGYTKLSEQDVLSFSYRHLIDPQDNPFGDDFETRHDMAIEAGYSRKLGEQIGIGSNLRFLFSDKGVIQTFDTTGLYRDWGLAADLGLYGQHPLGNQNRYSVSWGFSARNLGSPIRYLYSSNTMFQPAILAAGTGFRASWPKFSMELQFDASRLMTPIKSGFDEDQNGIPDQLEDGVLSAIAQSFNDAGNYSSTEMQEMMYAAGIEMLIVRRVFVRGGYFYEHETFGWREVVTLGLGLRIWDLQFDAAHMTSPGPQRAPIDETVRFSLTYSI